METFPVLGFFPLFHVGVFTKPGLFVFSGLKFFSWFL